MLDSCNINDNGLIVVGGMTALVDLDLEKCENITRDGLVHLTGLNVLKDLYLSDCQVSGGMQWIGGLTSLQTLHVDGLCDADFRHFSRLELQDFSLRYCEYVTDETFEAINVNNLVVLYLECRPFGDMTLAHVARATGLLSLYFGYSQDATDEGLAQLITMRHLQSLTLDYCDFEAFQFAKLTALSELTLNGCEVIVDASLLRLDALKLKSLTVNGSDLLTDESLKQIIGVHTLERLILSTPLLTGTPCTSSLLLTKVR